MHIVQNVCFALNCKQIVVKSTDNHFDINVGKRGKLYVLSYHSTFVVIVFLPCLTLFARSDHCFSVHYYLRPWPARYSSSNHTQVRFFIRNQICRLSLLSGRNVRWPHRMLPPGESWWVCWRDRQTDGRTPDRYITLSARCVQRKKRRVSNATYMLLIHYTYFQKYWLGKLGMLRVPKWPSLSHTVISYCFIR